MKLKDYVSKVLKGCLASAKGFYNNLQGWADTKLENEKPSSKSSEYYFNLGWWILKLGLGVFMLWAFFAPLDRGVTAPGFVISDGQRKTVQAQTAGVIDDILVKEDEQVDEGQLLIKLNDTTAQAGINLSGVTLSGLDEQIVKSTEAIQYKRMQLSALQKQLSNAASMAKEGYIPQNQVLSLEQNVSSLKGSIANDEVNLTNLKRLRSEETQKVAVRDQDVRWTEIRAPVAGTIVNLQVFTKGGYITPGSKLLEISPKNAGLIAEAELPVNLIDKVREGMPVRMLFSAFNQNKTPQIPGVLTLVGNDRMTNPDTRKPFYKIQAIATDEGRQMLGDLEIQPGMPVDVFVKTGERTFVSYMLKPIIDRLDNSLREH